LWERVRLLVCDDEHKECTKSKESAPIAMFSAGLNTTRLFSQSLAQEVASHGFTVVLVDHPYDTDIVEYPNGDVVYGNHVKKPEEGNSTSVEFALEVRAKDISFVLDTLEIDQAGAAVMFGHSFGGAATATAMLHDERLRAGINIDGMMFGSVLNASLGSSSGPQAFLLWGSDGHNTTTDATWGEFWDTLKRSSHVDWAKEFSIINSTHGSAWDLNMLVDVTGIRDNLSELALSGVGPIPAAPIWRIFGRFIPSFFRFSLGIEPEDAILREPSVEFPDVIIIRQ
jgi:pimeloyl-ACP methyl ester carboxylesterase